jgi:hypothetical protein
VPDLARRGERSREPPRQRELTTSKEEPQSMNEELTTLNAQLQDKVLELAGRTDPRLV